MHNQEMEDGEWKIVTKNNTMPRSDKINSPTLNAAQKPVVLFVTSLESNTTKNQWWTFVKAI